MTGSRALGLPSGTDPEHGDHGHHTTSAPAPSPDSTPGLGLISDPAALPPHGHPHARQPTKPLKNSATKDLTGPAPSWMTTTIAGTALAETARGCSYRI
jgi:hypothetical protein